MCHGTEDDWILLDDNDPEIYREFGLESRLAGQRCRRWLLDLMDRAGALQIVRDMSDCLDASTVGRVEQLKVRGPAACGFSCGGCNWPAVFMEKGGQAGEAVAVGGRLSQLGLQARYLMVRLCRACRWWAGDVSTGSLERSAPRPL